jgi:hypothetical protein
MKINNKTAYLIFIIAMALIICYSPNANSASNSTNNATLTTTSISSISSVPARFRDVINVVNISIPTFYYNSVNHISVHVLYLGSNSSVVKFKLTSEGNVTIYNGTNQFVAEPNQYITNNFEIRTFNQTNSLSTKTISFVLNISTNGFSTEYKFPVIVLPEYNQSLQDQQSSSIIGAPYPFYITIILAIVIIAIILMVRLNMWKKFRNNEIAKEKSSVKKKDKNRK